MAENSKSSIPESLSIVNCSNLVSDTSQRMFYNLRTDPSEQSVSLDGVMNPSMRRQMQNLTLNDMQSDLSLSSKD